MIEGVQNKVLSVYLIKNLYLSDHPPFRAITIRMVFELIHEFIILGQICEPEKLGQNVLKALHDTGGSSMPGAGSVREAPLIYKYTIFQ